MSGRFRQFTNRHKLVTIDVEEACGSERTSKELLPNNGDGKELERTDRKDWKERLTFNKRQFERDQAIGKCYSTS